VAYDSNGDGVFDTSDARFGEFLVWQDANSDGISQAGELRSLAEVGVVSIDLRITKATPSDERGQAILGTSTFTRSDGSTGAVGDVALRWEDIPAPATPAQSAQIVSKVADSGTDAAFKVATDTAIVVEPEALMPEAFTFESFAFTPVDPSLAETAVNDNVATSVSTTASQFLQAMATFGVVDGEGELAGKREHLHKTFDLVATNWA
jgi:hypothetical protein